MVLQLDGLRKLMAALSGGIADDSLESLLMIMKLSFDAAKLNDLLIIDPFPALEGYHENLKSCENGQEFKATYVFRSKDDRISASAVFENGDMEVRTTTDPAWDISIIFNDVNAFWTFIFSGGNDILQSILENDVEVNGNLSYLYKFGFMARDLGRRLGLDLMRIH